MSIKLPRNETFRVEKDETVRFCGMTLTKNGRLEGLGIHPFGRVPVFGELVVLEPQGVRYLVARVCHFAFESADCHAELSVVETDID